MYNLIVFWYFGDDTVDLMNTQHFEWFFCVILSMMRPVCTMVQPIMVFHFLNLSKLSLSRGNKHSSACFLIQITVLVDTQILWPHPNQMSSHYASSSVITMLAIPIGKPLDLNILDFFPNFDYQFCNTHTKTVPQQREMEIYSKEIE